MDGETQCCRDASSCRLDLEIAAVPIAVSGSHFVDGGKPALKLWEEARDPEQPPGYQRGRAQMEDGHLPTSGLPEKPHRRAGPPLGVSP